MNLSTDPRQAMREALVCLSRGERLGRSRARSVMEEILTGSATPSQIGAFLMGMTRIKESPEEIAGFVEAMRSASVRIQLSRGNAIDLCGTGGDGSGTINISTGASLLAAAAGACVAKHGNRSASSRCGSADVLEAMGIPIDLPPERARDGIENLGFGFLFAPSFHPAMRHASGPRKELGIRTVFNVLGPLTNPAGVSRQLLGVYKDGLRRLLAEALLALGSERVWVVHAEQTGGGALDEIALGGPTRVTEVDGGSLREFEIVPEDAGITRQEASLAGGDAAHNADRLQAILSGEKGAQRDAVVLNAAAALVVAGEAPDLKHGARSAAEAIDSGKARDLVEKLRNQR